MEWATSKPEECRYHWEYFLLKVVFYLMKSIYTHSGLESVEISIFRKINIHAHSFLMYSELNVSSSDLSFPFISSVFSSKVIIGVALIGSGDVGR